MKIGFKYHIFALRAAMLFCIANLAVVSAACESNQVLHRLLISAQAIYLGASNRIDGLRQFENANPYDDAAQMISNRDYRLLGVMYYSVELPGVESDTVKRSPNGYITVAMALTESYEEERLLAIVRLYAARYNETVVGHLACQTAMKLATDNAGYAATTDHLHIISANVARYNAQPESLVVDLICDGLYGLGQVRWYNYMTGTNAKYSWHDFMQSYIVLTGMIQRNQFLCDYVSYSTNHSLYARICGTNQYIDFFPYASLSNDWYSLGLTGSPTIEIDLMLFGKQRDKVFIDRNGRNMMMCSSNMLHETWAAHSVRRFRISTNDSEAVGLVSEVP
jgi:hypothetical protein